MTNLETPVEFIFGTTGRFPNAQTIEDFALIKGVYQMHSKATGKDLAKSKLLAGFKTTFTELIA